MSDFFYDGQIRRYVTQFMRVFIGFKYQDGIGELKYVPVAYGDMTRQVGSLIMENSENKMPTVPKIACYITGLEMDTSRISDPTFISKLHVRERDFEIVNGERVYNQTQGANYTVERLMPTPYKLSLKADIWTSNTEQKLQLMEQILMLFHPSLELQTTDNYIDWTSLTVLDLTSINFSSRSIPVGTESEIDIASLEFTTPIWISTPAKVKKLGIVKNIIMNIFTDTGDLKDLESLTFNSDTPTAQIRTTISQFGVYLIKNPQTGSYECSVIDKGEVLQSLDKETVVKISTKNFDWHAILDVHGGYTGTSKIFFQKPNGFEIAGTFSINEIEPSILVVDFDEGTVPANSLIGAVDEQGRRLSGASAGTIDAIINPQTFNPVAKFNGKANIPVGIRYLILEDIGGDSNSDGADGWKNVNGDDNIFVANSIIEWNGSSWSATFEPDTDDVRYVSNLTTGIQYKWENGGWLKSFEGEYAAGYWRFDLDA
jgi:hypothetical protein